MSKYDDPNYQRELARANNQRDEDERARRLREAVEERDRARRTDSQRG